MFQNFVDLSIPHGRPLCPVPRRPAVPADARKPDAPSVSPTPRSTKWRAPPPPATFPPPPPARAVSASPRPSPPPPPPPRAGGAPPPPLLQRHSRHLQHLDHFAL